MLSDNDSDGDDLQQITINEHFAKAYAHRKEREELTKLKEKYGSDAEEGDENESEDSEDTDEDEDGEELTPAVDAAILRTLARIKRKDPGIYDTDKDVFEEEQKRTKSSFSFSARKDKGKDKPLLLHQHILNSTLNSKSRSPSPVPEEPTHVQEQAILRKETISAFHSAVPRESAASGNEDDILIPREKTKDELEYEQEEYREFLAREVGEDIGGLVSLDNEEATRVEEQEDRENEEYDAISEESSDKKKKKKKKKKKAKSREEADHEFLMNYILNRGWIDKSIRHVPTFDEITGVEGPEKGRLRRNKGEDQVETGRDNIAVGDGVEQEDGFDEEFDDVVETFESSYNFRFEEPDAAVIPTHPREIQSTVRREDNPRKAARERRKERKEEKLVQKREEIKRLKSLKMKEIRDKLDRIGKEGGKSVDDEALAQLDLEGDWDPDAHDRQMEGIYGEDDGAVDMDKPTWDDDIDVADIIPYEPEAGPSSASNKKNKKKKKKTNKDDGDGDGVDVDIMDADYLGGPSESKSGIDQKALDAAMDDVYGLEFNDLVGELPTRFKYTPVLPQAYGMSATDILLADDADLNDVVGLRTLAPYRRDGGRTWDAQRGHKLQELRKGLAQKRGYLFGGANEDAAGEGGETAGIKKRKGKKERLKAKLATTVSVEGEPSNGTERLGEDSRRGGEDVEDDDIEPASKKRKRRHKKTTQTEDNQG